jgi:hypothetical protein
MSQSPYREIFRGEILLNCILVAYAGVAATGAILVFKIPRVSIWLVTSSALAVLYGAMFLVMGGIEDESRGYALMVLAVTVLSIGTLLRWRRAGGVSGHSA